LFTLKFIKIRKYDLEERLISFAIAVLEVADVLPSKYSANHLGNQLARSSTSPALNPKNSLENRLQ
jgi:four helix bundle protein